MKKSVTHFIGQDAQASGIAGCAILTAILALSSVPASGAGPSGIPLRPGEVTFEIVLGTPSGKSPDGSVRGSARPGHLGHSRECTSSSEGELLRQSLRSLGSKLQSVELETSDPSSECLKQAKDLLAEVAPTIPVTVRELVDAKQRASRVAVRVRSLAIKPKEEKFEVLPTGGLNFLPDRSSSSGSGIQSFGGTPYGSSQGQFDYLGSAGSGGSSSFKDLTDISRSKTPALVFDRVGSAEGSSGGGRSESASELGPESAARSQGVVTSSEASSSSGSGSSQTTTNAASTKEAQQSSPQSSQQSAQAPAVRSRNVLLATHLGWRQVSDSGNSQARGSVVMGARGSLKGLVENVRLLGAAEVLFPSSGDVTRGLFFEGLAEFGLGRPKPNAAQGLVALAGLRSFSAVRQESTERVRRLRPAHESTPVLSNAFVLGVGHWAHLGRFQTQVQVDAAPVLGGKDFGFALSGNLEGCYSFSKGMCLGLGVGRKEIKVGAPSGTAYFSAIGGALFFEMAWE